MKNFICFILSALCLPVIAQKVTQENDKAANDVAEWLLSKAAKK